MAVTIFILLATVVFAINLIFNIILLAVAKNDAFPLGNIIGVFLTMSLFVYGVIVLISP